MFYELMYKVMKSHIEFLETRLDELQERINKLETKIEELKKLSKEADKEYEMNVPLRKNNLFNELFDKVKEIEPAEKIKINCETFKPSILFGVKDTFNYKSPKQKLDDFIEINNLKANIPNFYFENCNDVYRSLLHILEQEVVDADDEGYVVRFIDVDFDVKDGIPKLIIYMQESSGMHVQTYKYNKEDEEFYFEDSSYLHNFFE